jgi:hypothetical protein
MVSSSDLLTKLSTPSQIRNGLRRNCGQEPARSVRPTCLDADDEVETVAGRRDDREPSDHDRLGGRPVPVPMSSRRSRSDARTVTDCWPTSIEAGSSVVKTGGSVPPETRPTLTRTRGMGIGAVAGWSDWNSARRPQPPVAHREPDQAQVPRYAFRERG